MFRRYTTVAMSGLLVTGLALVLGGCADSTSSPAASSTAQPAAQTQPEPTTHKGKKAKDPFADMGIKEKREWRRQQRAAGKATGQTP